MNSGEKFYSGTSGLLLAGPKSTFPEGFRDKSRLAYYAYLFNTVEINSSFYKDPKPGTIKKWLEEVPENFRFTFKLSRAVTHAKNLDYDAEDLYRFMLAISHAGNKKACLLIQFPASIKNDRLQQVTDLLAAIRHADGGAEWKIAVEFRHASWYHPGTYALLDRFNACIVLHDIPASATPLVSLDAGFVYLRFHGPGGRYRGSYTDEFLREWSLYIKTQIKAGKIVYCYFNNTMGDAFNNLRRLNELVGTA